MNPELASEEEELPRHGLRPFASQGRDAWRFQTSLRNRKVPVGLQRSLTE